VADGGPLLIVGSRGCFSDLWEARFDLACAQLAEPSLKFIDVAMMSGSDSPQHFTRTFRLWIGAQ